MRRKTVKKLPTKNLSDNPIFSGEYRVSVSENRVTVPEKIYNQLKSANGLSGLRITRSPEGCVVIVPSGFWDFYCAAITEGKTSSIKEQLTRTSIAPAKTVSLESKRRLSIPYSFVMSPLAQAKRVVVVGLSRWIEIWSEEQWERSLVQFAKEGRNP